MAKDKIIFTQSRMGRFLECERKEWFSYQVGGVGLQPAVTEDYFIEGELGHYALAMWYETGAHSKNKQPLMLRDNMQKRINELIAGMGTLSPEQDNEMRAKMAAMVGACNGYRIVNKDDFKRWEILAIEKEFEIEIAGITFRGKLDLIVKDDSGIGFIEHKFLRDFSVDNWVNLPLNLQQLMYSMGCQKIVGEAPKWYQWDIVKKSGLRRKGMTGEGKIPESLLEYEARVQSQYTTEPEKMFFRPPPRMVEVKALESVQAHLTAHIESWRRVNEGGKLPPMRWPSCAGMYGKGCFFGPACVAESVGHKQGWNAPECSGLYRLKDAQHPELEGR